jgi:hypothetical protein
MIFQHFAQPFTDDPRGGFMRPADRPPLQFRPTDLEAIPAPEGLSPDPGSCSWGECNILGGPGVSVRLGWLPRETKG